MLQNRNEEGMDSMLGVMMNEGPQHHFMKDLHHPENQVDGGRKSLPMII